MILIVKKIYSLLNENQKKQSIFFLILLFFSTIFEGLSVALVFPLIKGVIDEDFFQNVESKFSFLELSNLNHEDIISICLLAIISTYLIKSIYLIFFSWWKSNFILKINNEISGRLFKKYIYSPYTFFFSKNSSEFIRNIYSESRYINSAIDNFFRLIIELFSIVIIVAILLVIQLKSTLIMIAIFGSFLLIFNTFTSHRIKTWGFKKQHYVAKIIQNMQQSFGSIKEIILRGNQKFFSKDFDNLLFNVNEQARKLMILSEIPKNLLETITVIIISVLITTYSYSDDNIINLVPVVGLFGAAALRIVPGVNRLIACKQHLDACYPAVKLVHDELKEFNYVQEIKLDGATNTNDNFKFEKEIELKNIEYKYPNSDKSIIKNFNLKIKKNDCICIVGKSGSGKTTLVDLISGLLEPVNGQILLDGKKVSLNNYKWKSLVGYVTQSVYLIDDTIKNNILIGANSSFEFDEKRFNSAIKNSQLDIFIDQIPEGINFKVGENGIKLSGGQKQRIGIARTLYTNPKILILDEITSSLDIKTAENLLKSLNNLTGKITTIYISHNDQVIKNANIVYEIEKDSQNKLKLSKKIINENKK
jgi:ATP-binding cassette, subfamily B, bacterial PglK